MSFKKYIATACIFTFVGYTIPSVINTIRNDSTQEDFIEYLKTEKEKFDTWKLNEKKEFLEELTKKRSDLKDYFEKNGHELNETFLESKKKIENELAEAESTIRAKGKNLLDGLKDEINSAKYGINSKNEYNISVNPLSVRITRLWEENQDDYYPPSQSILLNLSQTYIQAIENRKHIDDVVSGKVEDPKLLAVLETLDSKRVFFDKYVYIDDILPTIERDGAKAPISEIIHKGGLCRHICSSAASLLDYSGYETTLKIGQSKAGKGHVWLEVKVGDVYLKLDPTQFDGFKQCEYVSF